MSLHHPNFLGAEWLKYRFIKDGGDDFIEQYLVKFSEREGDTDFIDRKKITPIPGFASAALVDIRNSIYQRMPDITRKGGSDSYNAAVRGENGGIDLTSATMNHFIGKDVLPELLFLGKVGVYIDMPTIGEATRRDTKNIHPYVYIYTAEEIVNWSYVQTSSGIEFDRLLLEETYTVLDELGLPKEDKTRYRFIKKENGVVTVQYLDEDGKLIDDPIIELGIKKIPFVLFELDRSLLKDVANHQIALLNLESSDISYTLKACFPFYTEQRGNLASEHLKNSNTSNANEIELGPVQGRTYGKDMDRPGFINPSSEPINASMAKQKELKEDIRALINLALSSIRPKFASAEAKQFDERGLESGLSFLGLVLELGEQQIANIYSQYENDNTVAIIDYPERYGLKTDSERMDEAKQLNELITIVPSETYRKATTKEIVRILMGTKSTNDELEKIFKEIDDATYTNGTPEDIHADVERGILSLETAAIARGYDKDEPKKAEEDHLKRLKRIEESQAHDTNPDTIVNPDAARAEKEVSQDPDKKE